MLSIQNLKSIVYKKYNVICFEDLADVISSHSKIYKFLKPLHQDSYHDMQRLCFFTSHTPSDKILEHIQRAATSVDISNFFIQIFCTHNIKDGLVRANTKYGYDRQAIQSECVDIVPTQSLEDRHIAYVETLCPMPWIGLYVHPDRNVAPCCVYKKTIGNIDKTLPADILSTNNSNQLRASLRNRQQPKECNSCWINEQAGTTSLRQYYLTKYKDSFDSDWIDNPGVKTLTINPDITCNFKCRICSPEQSSLLAVEFISNETNQQIISKMKYQLKQGVGNDSFLTVYQSLYSDLRDLHILGGEPLLLPKLKEFLHSIIDSSHANHVQIEINTNCSRYDQSIVDLLEQFCSAEILLSIDDINKRFEIQRGSSWDLVCENIQKWLKNKATNTTIKLMASVNIQNVLYLDQLVNFAQDLGLEIVWQYVLNPNYFCIDNMTLTAKNLVWQTFQNSQHTELKKIAERVKNSAGSDGRSFLEHTLAYDQKRNQKFSDSHSEIYTAMSGK